MADAKRMLGLKRDTLFQAFKYSIYTLIFINVVYFFMEDLDASAFTFRDGLSWRQAGDAFATAIDSFSWLILLLLFELETYVISDDRLKGGLKWLTSSIAVICYIFLVIAFLGYYDRLEMAYDFTPLAGTACDHVGSVLSYATGIDEYFELSAASCSEVPNLPLFLNEEVNILTDGAALTEMKRLTATDVANAAAWLLVVVVLQVDVLLQLTGELTRRLYTINVIIKAIIYLTLTICCFYWLMLGTWIDFWDALLWLLAFIVIELNLFKWHEAELEEEDREAGEYVEGEGI